MTILSVHYLKSLQHLATVGCLGGFVIDENLSLSAIDFDFDCSYNELISLCPSQFFDAFCRHADKMVDSAWLELPSLQFYCFKAHLSAPYTEILLLDLKALRLDASRYSIKTYKYS